ncbi:MAG: FliM/FliN family flagellar motor switch protein [Limnochordia bacterium]
MSFSFTFRGEGIIIAMENRLVHRILDRLLHGVGKKTYLTEIEEGLLQRAAQKFLPSWAIPGEGQALCTSIEDLPMPEDALIYSFVVTVAGVEWGQASLILSERTLHTMALEEQQVVLTALLGTAILQGQELMDLDIGDVLVLDSPIGEPLSVYLGPKIRFRGHPGVSQGKMAVEISHILF